VLENFVIVVGSMGLPWNNSFEYFAWNSKIHQSSVVNSSLGWLLKMRKENFTLYFFKLKQLLHSFLIYNINYFILCKTKRTCFIQIKGNFI